MTSLRDYEDWVLLLTAILAAIAEALETQPRFTLWAIIIGAIAKALLSILSKSSAGGGGLG